MYIVYDIMYDVYVIICDMIYFDVMSNHLIMIAHFA